MGTLSRKKVTFRPMLFPLSAANCNKMCAETKNPTIDENSKGHLHKSCYPLKATLPRETKIRSRRSDTGGKNTFENRVFVWISKIKLAGFRKRIETAIMCHRAAAGRIYIEPRLRTICLAAVLKKARQKKKLWKPNPGKNGPRLQNSSERK